MDNFGSERLVEGSPGIAPNLGSSRPKLFTAELVYLQVPSWSPLGTVRPELEVALESMKETSM